MSPDFGDMVLDAAVRASVGYVLTFLALAALVAFLWWLAGE